MTITYTPEGGGAISLAGAEADLADGPLDLQGMSESVVQTDMIVRGQPARFARGNRLIRFSFTAKKQHADYEAAHAYWLAQMQAYDNIGSVVLTQGAATLTLTKASVIPSGETKGATSFWRYDVEGIKTA